MGELTQVRVPDIGDFTDVPIIEIQVKPGDRVKAEDALITLESDKASMEVPSPSAGVVKALAVKLGDKVSRKSGGDILPPIPLRNEHERTKENNVRRPEQRENLIG